MEDTVFATADDLLVSEQRVLRAELTGRAMAALIGQGKTPRLTGIDAVTYADAALAALALALVLSDEGEPDGAVFSGAVEDLCAFPDCEAPANDGTVYCSFHGLEVARLADDGCPHVAAPDKVAEMIRRIND